VPHRRTLAPLARGPHAPSRAALLAVLAAVGIIGCERSNPVTGPATPSPVARPPSGRLLLRENIITYEGSGQIVHPDVVFTPPGVFAHPWHLVLTPYPVAMGAEFENPSVFESDDGTRWGIEPGVVNPLALPRPQSLGELNSDPALLYVAAVHELWLYYRSYRSDTDFVWLMRSSDAINWSPPELLFQTLTGGAISPSVVQSPDGHFLMWTVNGHCGAGDTRIELRRSADGLQWDPPEPVTLGGFSPWHVFVRWVSSLNSWVMLTNVKPAKNTCLTKDLWVAFSDDGVHWTHGDHPWLSAGQDDGGMFSSVVYRSAFAEIGDSLRFWYSGATTTVVSYTCHRGEMMCQDSVMRWDPVGSEIRPATDILPRPLN